MGHLSKAFGARFNRICRRKLLEGVHFSCCCWILRRFSTFGRKFGTSSHSSKLEGAYFYKGRIPGSQTIERAEAYAVLGALLISETNIPLTVYTDCQKLVNDIQRFQNYPPQIQEVAKMSNRSVLMRILHELRTRKYKTQITYLQNHVKNVIRPQINPSRSSELRRFSNLADKEAKLSLSLPRPSIPDEKRFHLYTTLNKHSSSTSEPEAVSEENNLWKMYQKRFQSSCQHYNFKGKWHLYMLLPTIWQDASFSILHQKRGKESLKRFIIQVLGRTLPTNHRLNITHPRLYPLHNCQFCQANDESIEHVFFQCPHFSPSRLTLQTDTVAKVKATLNQLQSSAYRPGRGLPDDTSIKSIVANSLFPLHNDPDLYRTLSASQIPMQICIWLESFLHDQSQILKVGCTLHEHLASSYQKLWKLRCSKITIGKVDFRSRFSTFARPVPLHELNDDDFAANFKLGNQL